MNASRKIAVLSSCVGWAVDYQDVPFSRRSICPIKKLMNFQFLNDIWNFLNLRFEINFTLRPFLWKWSLWKIDNIIFKIKFYFHIGSIHIETKNGSEMGQNWTFSPQNLAFWPRFGTVSQSLGVSKSCNWLNSCVNTLYITRNEMNVRNECSNKKDVA